MKLVNQGKTKDVYQLADGNYLLKFKDDLTGEDGKFDPGANTVGLTVAGAGQAGLRISKYFFELLEEKGIPTHYLEANLEESTMVVKPAKVFGNGLEIICRYRAVGSFLRRYGMYAKEGQPLDGLVEVTLKDDQRQDPPITGEALEMLGILTAAEYQKLVQLTKQISQIVKDELAKRGIELYDIKLEFGRVGESGEIALIDEISGGNMRAYKDGKPVSPIALAKYFT
ncbi:MAG: phosphoribosylaminoimidazolesuccinocarboxamide synthase [Firmicutes bacterium]|nr:phosphoribosylaminoimidazolesuccinocarboxamide synthase [Bacillota bacterium]